MQEPLHARINNLCHQLQEAARQVADLESSAVDAPEPEDDIDVAIRIAVAIDPRAWISVTRPGHVVVNHVCHATATRTSLALHHLATVALPECARLRIAEIAAKLRQPQDAADRRELENDLQRIALAADWDLDAARAA